jgi:O-antigen ligase
MRIFNKELKFGFLKIALIVLNIIIAFSRFLIHDVESFQGNLLSLGLVIIIFALLCATFFLKRYDEFILVWLSFYFSSPILKIPWIDIGALGIINGIFLPLMLLSVFRLNNKYFLNIMTILIYALVNISSANVRVLLSDLFELIAPFVFFYFIREKANKLDEIMYWSVIIALINLPMGLYQYIAKPAWGGVSDWRGFRIFGNLYWHNSYSFYLLPLILLLYAKIRSNFSAWTLIGLISLIIMDVLTFSRDGLISLAIGFVVFEALYNSGFKINLKKIVLAGIIISGALFYVFVFSNMDSHLTLETLDERTTIWNTIIPIMKNNLTFGLGLGSYELHRALVLKSLSTHNFYLFLVFQLGFVGLSLILLFLLFSFIHLAKSMNLKAKFRSSELGISLIASILAFSLVGNAAFTQVVALNIWSILACCVRYHEKD